MRAWDTQQYEVIFIFAVYDTRIFHYAIFHNSSCLLSAFGFSEPDIQLYTGASLYNKAQTCHLGCDVIRVTWGNKGNIIRIHYRLKLSDEWEINICTVDIEWYWQAGKLMKLFLPACKLTLRPRTLSWITLSITTIYSCLTTLRSLNSADLIQYRQHGHSTAARST